jgi:hypothetical protein
MLAGGTAASGTRTERVPAVRASTHTYPLAIGLLTAAVAAFLLSRLQAWPPHEDETLVFFISRQPLGDVLDTVVGERGGAPLHFFLAHAAVSVWSDLTALRLVSIVFAVASIPTTAALVARLTDRATAVVATAIAAASWMMLFHGLYGRMYSLFLCTSALSFLALLAALERGGRRRWALWAAATMAAIASHPYGAVMLAAQVVFVALERRRRVFPIAPAAAALAAVAVLAAPLWLTYTTLADRFDVGFTGGGGSKLGSPVDVFSYLLEVMGDFGAGWLPALAAIGALALLGLWTLARTRPAAALLAASVALVPAAGLMAVRSGSSIGLESRHLIFVLPVFAMAVAAGLLRGARAIPRGAPAALAAGVAAIAAVQLAWGWHTTPALYTGESSARHEARGEAAAWLAATGRRDDVLLGYEPLYLDAWEQGAPVGNLFVPRADAGLELEVLRDASQPLGRGVWVFDATDQEDEAKQRLTVEARTAGAEFETRAFGPFLVVRTREPVETPEWFLEATIRVQRLGIKLGIGDAGLNLDTAEKALARLKAR